MDSFNKLLNSFAHFDFPIPSKSQLPDCVIVATARAQLHALANRSEMS